MAWSIRNFARAWPLQPAKLFVCLKVDPSEVDSIASFTLGMTGVGHHDAGGRDAQLRAEWVFERAQDQFRLRPRGMACRWSGRAWLENGVVGCCCCGGLSTRRSGSGGGAIRMRWFPGFGNRGTTAKLPRRLVRSPLRSGGHPVPRAAIAAEPGKCLVHAPLPDGDPVPWAVGRVHG